MLLSYFFLILLSPTFAYVIVRQIGESSFEDRYQLHDQESQTINLLIISCKEYQVLSLMILPQGASEEEHPRYKIFRPENTQSYNHKSYAFLSSCHVDIDVKNKQSLVVIRRKGSSEPLFEIKHISFEKGHHTIETIDNSQIFGLGERFQQHFDVRDGTWALWNRDRPWQIDQGLDFKATQTYGFQPVYLAREAASKLFHVTFFKTVFAMNVVKKQQKLTYHVINGNAHFLIFIGGDNPETLLQKYHRYIGPSLIPPFWSLGYHQCRWGYKNIAALQKIIEMHDQHGIPIDVVWNDLDYMHQKQDFTIDQNNFPLKEMNDKILSTVHYVPLLDAGVSTSQVEAYVLGNQMNAFIKLNGKNYLGEVWPGVTSFVDYLHPNGSKYWNAMLKELYTKIKFSGIWLDMNEIANFKGNAPTDQTYRVQHVQMLSQMTIDLKCSHFNTQNFIKPYQHTQVHTYYGHLMVESTNRFLENQGLRPFIITRSNAVGTGSYAGHWTGDNVANWRFLRLSISGNFLYQIFGIHMVGADICGFHEDTTAELCSRWTQLGAFYPFARNHNQQKYISQEVYALGETHLQTSKLSLNLRYSLLKQYYSAFVKTQGTGSIYRPLMFEFPNDEHCYETDVLEEQFMIGNFLMGTPIVSQDVDSKIAYFPQGWFDYFDGSYKKQRQKIVNTLPAAPSIFIREGKIVFVNEPKTRTKNLDNNFTLKIGFKKQQSHYLAEGYIMSISDYENNSKIEKCIKQGCFYKINAIIIEQGQIELSWIYTGAEKLNERVNITQLEIYQQGKPIVKKSVSFTLQKQSTTVVKI